MSGHPSADRAGTVRQQRADTIDDRLDPNAARVILTDPDARGGQWTGLAGPWAGLWLSHDDVVDWPVVPHVCWAAAMDRLAGATAPAPAGPLVGDMGVEAFAGESDGS